MPNDIKIREENYAHLHLDWDKIDWEGLYRPFNNYRSEEQYIEVLKAIRDVKNLYFTCKYILNVDPVVFQICCLEAMFSHAFPMLVASRGLSKSFMLAMFSILRCLILQGSKVIIVGAAFRQSKVIFEYMEDIWSRAPILRDICGDNSGPKRQTDAWVFKIGDSQVTAIPLGDGSKIRGQRANCIIADEFQSVPKLVYEVVVANFANVAASPAESVKRAAKVGLLKEKGLLTQEPENVINGVYRGNQAILSGTGDWGFKNFAEYWKRYRSFIYSRGDKKIIQEISGDEPQLSFDYKDYVIIRIPVELAPPGFMEDKHVQRAKATSTTSVHMQEYGACFPEDSDKFYRRSLIESCVTNEIIHLPSGPVQFHAVTKGIRGRKYIMGIDPASESNNFAVVVLEIHEDHRRVVYCWTTNRERHMAKVRQRFVDDNSFYAYCARKIRTLIQIFPTEYISMDSQGGGIGVMEELHNIKSLQHGELPIWSIHRYIGKEDNPILWPNAKDWGHDDEAGLHILEMVAMSNADYVADANHGMRKDLESKVLLFPSFDPISVAEAFIDDSRNQRQDDTLEDCVLEIEELKTELTTIDHITSQTSRDKWATPETVEEGGKKGHLRKDRYCALLTANSLARRIAGNRIFMPACSAVGGFARDYARYGNDSPHGRLYEGPEWFTSAADKLGIMITQGMGQDPRV